MPRNSTGRVVYLPSSCQLSQSIAGSVPGSLPIERIAALRQAFTSAMHDPALLDEVQKLKLKLKLDPLEGAALQADIAGSGPASPELIARARRVAEK